MSAVAEPSLVRRGVSAARFWARDIWGHGWDRERRALLFKHYWSYLRYPPVPPRHQPPPGPCDSLDQQRMFAEAYRRRIEAVQQQARPRSGVRLTFRPLGKNLRHVGTALRHNVDRGRATVIMSDGPPHEVAALASSGRPWSPWLWSRRGAADTATPGPTWDAAVAWNQFFEPLAQPAGGLPPAARPDHAWPAPAYGSLTAPLVERVMKAAVATSYVFRPIDALAGLAASRKQAIGWPDRSVPVLGMHVRRGDAATSDPTAPRKSNRRSFSMASYLQAADTLCERYGISRIFLATESRVEIARARELRPQYTFLHLDHDRSLFPDIGSSGQYIEFLAMDHPEHARALALSAILDLQCFCDCHAFVGAFNSEFSVLAWLLAVGGQSRVVPYISLSEPARGLRLHPFDALLNVRNNCPLDLYHW